MQGSPPPPPSQREVLPTCSDFAESRNTLARLAVAARQLASSCNRAIFVTAAATRRRWMGCRRLWLPHPLRSSSSLAAPFGETASACILARLRLRASSGLLHRPPPHSCKSRSLLEAPLHFSPRRNQCAAAARRGGSFRRRVSLTPMEHHQLSKPATMFGIQPPVNSVNVLGQTMRLREHASWHPPPLMVLMDWPIDGQRCHIGVP